MLNMVISPVLILPSPSWLESTWPQHFLHLSLLLLQSYKCDCACTNGGYIILSNSDTFKKRSEDVEEHIIYTFGEATKQKGIENNYT